MYQVVRLPKEERDILFLNTAAQIGLNAAVVEKDFWVCLVLDVLFHKSEWKSKMAFKGGTSLSKAYHLIERFSEDIDLILDWRVLGYGNSEPWEDRSNTKQQKFIDESKERLFAFLKDDFIPKFRAKMSEVIGEDAKVYIGDEDSGTVMFAYPQGFKDRSLQHVIRLEIGALAAWTPTRLACISPYAAEVYGNVFEKGSTEILTTTAERSFWEKATILHQEALRPESLQIPARYSRHYYDIYCMAKTEVKDNAIKDPALLEAVAHFKQKFYPRSLARYDLAKIGTLRLIPANHSLKRLREDYMAMRPMIYGQYPDFGEMMAVITKLEQEINVKTNI